MSAPRMAQAHETHGARVTVRAHASGAASAGGRMANQERMLPRRKVAATAEMSAKRGWRQTWFVAMLALLSMLGAPVAVQAANDATTPKAATPTATPPRVAPALGSGLTPGAPLEILAIVGDPNSAGRALPEAEEVQGGGSPSETVEFYAYDAIGSVRMVFDAAGTVVGQATYSPFGQEIAGTTGMPAQRFTGQERDHEAQLDYFNARAFQARTGRFTTPDPLYTGALDAPQRWNRYAYALNSALAFADPSGLSPQPLFRMHVTEDYVDPFRALVPSGGSGAGGGWALGSGRSLANRRLGGGTQKRGPAPLAALPEAEQKELEKAVEKLTNYTPDKKCQEQVLDKLPDSFDLGDFQQKLSMGSSFYDGTLSSASPVGTIYPQLAGNAFLKSKPGVSSIADVFRSNPGINAMASIVSERFTAFFRPSAIGRGWGSGRRNMSLVFHEGLHWYGQGNSDYSDEGLMDAFKLSGPSGSISSHLEQKCR